MVIERPLGHVFLWGEEIVYFPCINLRTLDEEQPFPDEGIEKSKDLTKSSGLKSRMKADDSRAGFFPIQNCVSQTSL